MVSDSSLTKQIASKYGIDIGCLSAGAERAESFLAELRTMLQEKFPPAALPGVDIVVVGSIAKRQCTLGSDLDFFGVTEGATDPSRTDPIVRAMLDLATAAGYDLPFAAGPNAVFVPRGELETFHLLRDNNRHVFRRMSILGSVSVYRPEMRASIFHNMISEFIGRDREPRTRGVIDQIMLLARLGNMTVEMRMPDRTNSDGGLVQWAKAFTLYRIELASQVVATIRGELASKGRSREELVESVVRELDRTPLERLLAWHDDVSPAGRQALASMITVANEVLRLLAAEGVRRRLFEMADDAPTNEIRAAFSGHMKTLREAMLQLFYREDVLRPWTEEVGLFG